MKTPVEKRKPSGLVDYLALALTTFGVGYGPVAPGTWGSAVAVGIYLVVAKIVDAFNQSNFGITHHASVDSAIVNAMVAITLMVFCLIGIIAAGRSIPLLGNEDPSEAVVDEVMGQLVTFCFVPFGISWAFVLLGFLLFRAFDIWKPYPVRALEVLPGGLGVCADDLVAGVYAGICLSIVYSVSLLF